MVYLTNIDLGQNQLMNAIIQPLATAPSNPKLGQIYTNSSTSKIMWYTGTQWQTVGVVVESSATNGNIKVDGVEMQVYSLPTASATVLGGIKVGVGLSIDANGVLTASEAGSVEWSNVLNKPTDLVEDASYVHTDNNYTTTEKNKLAGIASGAEVNVNADWDSSSGDSQILNKPTKLSSFTNDSDFTTNAALNSGLENKVDKVAGKQLSTNDYTTVEKNKLSGIAVGAEVNVQSDWNQTVTSADDFILNKPTKVSDFSNDSGFITSTVNNLTNYYLKTETYTKTEVNDIIGQIATIQIQVVENLPDVGKSNIIYLVPKNPGQTSNIYDEYIWAGTVFEKVGDTSINLSEYLEKTGDSSNTTVSFVESSNRNLPVTGDSVSTIIGKTIKYLKDLKISAFTGDYDDLVNKPSAIKKTSFDISTIQTTNSITISDGTTIVGVMVVDDVTKEIVMCDITVNGLKVTATVITSPEHLLKVIVTYY